MAVFAKIGVLLLIAFTASAYEQSLLESVQFASKFYETVREAIPDQENVVMSPLSVRTALGLLLMGARGKTANELVRGLYLPSYDRQAIGTYFQQLGDHYDGEVLKIANKIFIGTGVSLNPNFNDVVSKSFKSEAQSVNFADNVKAVQIINSWVAEKTNGKIEKLFDPSSLSPNTRMALANAVYFKGLWQNEFNKDFTYKSPFFVNEKESVEVDMMYTKASLSVARSDDLDATIVMIPYNKSDLSMLIALPNSRNGLNEMEAKMAAYDFTKLEGQFSKTKITLHLPKFEIESSVDLPDILTKMGMGTMFSPLADFGNLLADNEPLRVDSGIHKAYIKVDEEGTEAAGATGFAVVLSMPLNPAPVVKVDHPFFFAIVGRYDAPFFGSVRRP